MRKRLQDKKIKTLGLALVYLVFVVAGPITHHAHTCCTGEHHDYPTIVGTVLDVQSLANPTRPGHLLELRTVASSTSERYGFQHSCCRTGQHEEGAQSGCIPRRPASAEGITDDLGAPAFIRSLTPLSDGPNPPSVTQTGHYLPTLASLQTVVLLI
jgi:hypothetical protein